MVKNAKKVKMGEIVLKLKCVPVTDDALLRANGVFLATGTLRKMHHLGQKPRIFLKIGGRLFIDLVEWEKMVEDAKNQRNLKAEKIEKGVENGN